MTDLRAFAEAISAEPLQWGWNDCSAVPWRWLRANGVDVELPLYASRDQAHGIIDRHGDLVATWDAVLRGRLRARFGEPQPGDIAVIGTRLYGQIGGIVASGSILLIRTDDGRGNGGFRWFGPVRRFVKVWALS